MVSKAIRSLAIGVGVVGLYSALFVGINAYKNHNVAFMDATNAEIELRQMDGLIANSSLIRRGKAYSYPNGSIKIKIDDGFFADTSYYTAEVGSMTVNRVYIQYTGSTRSLSDQVFYRDKHFKTYPQLFEKADKEFAKKYEEFRPKLEEMLSK